MSRLRKHGLVISRPGTNGGWRLVMSPEELSLRDVYHAVSNEALLVMHQHPNMNCPIGGNIQNTLNSVFEEAQTALEVELSKVSVARVLENTLHGKTNAHSSESLQKLFAV